jgi:hypothetical protein
MEQRKVLIDILGVIGIIVSVVYLGQQVDENTKQLRTQSHFNAASLGQRPLEIILENKDAFEDVSFCNITPGDASKDRRERCSAYYLMLLNAWEYFFYQEQDESIPKYLGTGADAW